jgi:pimeloyl-ACP methyl ester carboxylesterase
MVNLDPFRSPAARAKLIEKYDAILAGWPVPHEERDVETAFGATHLVVSGPVSAPPLVLLHGAATTATMWRPLIETLSASYRCYCVDTITEGNKSVATRRLRGVPDHVSWLQEVLRGLQIEHTRIAGLSYGGWLAANLAVHAPELVDKLLLLCPAATLAPIVPEFYFRMSSAGLTRSPDRARNAVRWLSTTSEAASDPIMDLVVTTLLGTRTLRTTVAFPTTLKDERLRGIKAPTSVFIGDREVIYRGGPRAAIARAETLIPDVQTRLLAGAGHALTLDCPDELADAMVNALV